jgi:hypothetical protein
MEDVHIIKDVLKENEFESLTQETKFNFNSAGIFKRSNVNWFCSGEYAGFDADNGDTFYLKFANPHLDSILFKTLEEHYKCSITPIVAFLRLNTGLLDNKQRIHSDRDILGDTPSHAAVYYITEDKTTENGTAFYRHKLYGDYLSEGIEQSEKEYSSKSLWERTGLVQGNANSMVTYPANRFHGRFPHKSWGKDETDGRLIWTAFFNLDK